MASSSCWLAIGKPSVAHDGLARVPAPWKVCAMALGVIPPGEQAGDHAATHHRHLTLYCHRGSCE